MIYKCTDKIFDRVKAGQSACDDKPFHIIKPIVINIVEKDDIQHK